MKCDTIERKVDQELGDLDSLSDFDFNPQCEPGY